MSADRPPRNNEPEARVWQSHNSLSAVVRGLVFAIPVLVSLLVLLVVGGILYHPPGWLGLLIWITQAAPLGAAVAVLASIPTRRALPLAMLLELDLVFPDEAPSRMDVAKRTSTRQQLREKLSEVRSVGLGLTENEAAIAALELAVLLSVHYRSTRGHAVRVLAHSKVIAEELNLPALERERLSWAMLLHDMGMLAIPSDILSKKGELSSIERQVVMNHPSAGSELLDPLAIWLGEWRLAAKEHHERWDGTGYPLGLQGANISLAGRIAAVADSYDAITSERSYKESMLPADARAEIAACSGTQFDPSVVRAFLAGLPEPKERPALFAWFAALGAASAQTSAVAAAGAIVALVGANTIPSNQVAEPLPFVETTTTTAAPSTTTQLTTTSKLETTTSVPTTKRPDPTTTSSTTETTQATSTAPPTTRRQTTTRPPTTTAPTTTASTTTTAPTTTTTAPSTTAAPPTFGSSTTAAGSSTTGG